MSVGPAKLIDESLKESIVNGFVRYDMVRTYQVLTTDRTDSSIAVLGASGLPFAGLAVLLSSGVPVYCTNRQAKRSGLQDTAKKWHVTTNWSNDAGQSFLRTDNGTPTFDPLTASRLIEVEYQESMEPIRDATFTGTTEGPYHDGTPAQNQPSWLQGHKGPIVNSAGDPIFAEKPNFNRVVTVWKWYRDYPSNLETYINNINSADLTLTQNDKDGERLSITFPKQTIRFGLPRVEYHWKDGRLFFRVGVVLVEDKRTWIHSELDRGQRMRVFVGQTRSDGSSWTGNQLAALEPPISPLGFTMVDIEQEGYAPGEPLRLNGRGVPCQYDTNTSNRDKSFYNNFGVFTETDFSGIDHLS